MSGRTSVILSAVLLGVICASCAGSPESTPAEQVSQPAAQSPAPSRTAVLNQTETPRATTTVTATPAPPTPTLAPSSTEPPVTAPPSPTRTPGGDSGEAATTPSSTSLPALTNQLFDRGSWNGAASLEPGNLDQLTYLGIQYLDPRRRAVNFKLHDWSVDGRWILTCTEERSSSSYQVFDLEAGERLSEVTFQEKICQGIGSRDGHLQFSRDGSLFSGWQGEARAADVFLKQFGIYDSSTAALLAPLEQVSMGRPKEFAFSSRGTRLAVSTFYPAHPASTADANVEGGKWIHNASDIQLFDTTTGKHWGTFQYRERWQIDDLEFSTRGEYLVAAGADQVTAWHMEGDQVRQVDCPMGAVTFSPTAEIAALACIPYQEDFYQLLWDPSSGALNRLTGAPETQYRELTFSPDGSLVAAGSDSGKVSIWHGVSGEHLYTLPYTFRDLEDLHFIFQGKLLALLKSNGTLMIFGLK